MKKIFILLLFSLCSCQFLSEVKDSIEPYVEMVKPANKEEIELLSSIISNTIILELPNEIDNVKTILNLVNKNIKENVITVPMIFNIPGLSERNKTRVRLLINIFEYKLGKIGFTTPEEHQWVLKLISSVHDKL